MVLEDNILKRKYLEFYNLVYKSLSSEHVL